MWNRVLWQTLSLCEQAYGYRPSRRWWTKIEPSRTIFYSCIFLIMFFVVFLFDKCLLLRHLSCSISINEQITHNTKIGKRRNPAKHRDPAAEDAPERHTFSIKPFDERRKNVQNWSSPHPPTVLADSSNDVLAAIWKRLFFTRNLREFRHFLSWMDRKLRKT